MVRPEKIYREMDSYRVFFFAAAMEAMIAPLLLLCIRYGYIPGPDGLPPGLWHAQEMIFGYTFAVIGGYLITRISLLKLVLLTLLWLAGRVVWFIDSGLPAFVIFLLVSLFPFALGLLTSQKFKAAKRLRNRMFSYVLICLAVLSGAFYLFCYMRHYAQAYTTLYVTLYLIALLIITMGGRLIPPATIGALRERGQEVRIPFQPTCETLCMALTASLMLIEVLPVAKTWTALPASGLAIILLVRISAWRSIGIMNNMAVLPLHLGYIWMAIGFGLLAAARLGALLTQQEAVHVITLGGIGTITLTMLIRITGVRSKRPPPGQKQLLLIHSLLIGALAIRLMAHSESPFSQHLLWISALLWGAAFALFIWQLRPFARPLKTER